jgi:hypothetical protein
MSDTSTNNNEHIERASESGRKVADEATRAGADVARRGAETARQALESGLNSTVHTFQRVTDQFTQALGVAGPAGGGIGSQSVPEYGGRFAGQHCPDEWRSRDFTRVV